MLRVDIGRWIKSFYCIVLESKATGNKTGAPVLILIAFEVFEGLIFDEMSSTALEMSLPRVRPDGVTVGSFGSDGIGADGSSGVTTTNGEPVGEEGTDFECPLLLVSNSGSGRLFLRAGTVMMGVLEVEEVGEEAKEDVDSLENKDGPLDVLP
jgi:hypothetical protein